MISLLGFLLALGPLVVFHELGHFLFAKLFGVKAEVFSVGFGPKLFSKRFGETEFRLAAIPLGGYVKLLGEDGERELTKDEKRRSLNAQEPWKRFLIYLAGPLFNLILAVVIFMGVLVVGEPQMASVLGRVVPESVAARSGLMSGDEVTAINSTPVSKFEDLILKINESPNKPLTFEIKRAGTAAPITVQVTPSPQEGYSVYGESTHVGEIEGLIPMARATNVGISDSKSPAAKMGLKTSDRLLTLNGEKIEDWESLEKTYSTLKPGSVLKFEWERPPVGEAKGGEKFSGELVKPVTRGKTPKDAMLAASLGLHSSELFLERVIETSPAAAAGLVPGDRIVSVNGRTLLSFFELKDAVQRAGESAKPTEITWERDGKIISAQVLPKGSEVKDIALKKSTQFAIGVVPLLVWAQPREIVERVWNPVKLVGLATARMVELSRRNLVSIGKMFSGDVSIGTLGGPILIGKIAGESIQRGLVAFLTTMAILSVGLGVLNLLPIPVLDGGHLMLIAFEMVRRKPLTLRQMEVAQQVGLSLILLLMVIVIKNDIARLPFFN